MQVDVLSLAFFIFSLNIGMDRRVYLVCRGAISGCNVLYWTHTAMTYRVSHIIFIRICLYVDLLSTSKYT